jgi:hypothetical protein
MPPGTDSRYRPQVATRPMAASNIAAVVSHPSTFVASPLVATITA